MNETTSRRDFLALTAAAATTAACSGASDDEAATMTKPLTDLAAAQAIAAMRAGELAAEDYAAALLDQCARWRHLNAWISFDKDKVLEDARAADRLRASGAVTGPLHGLPIPVKDSVNTRDYPTTGGTRALADFVPAADAELVRRLRAAGAIVMGKTNIHELSFGWTSNNHAFGPVRNPYDPSRIPGGSSGGTAAAVAARMAPLGIAEDTQGSIRVPAALCGIAGFRPTQDRYPNQGVVPITPLFDQVGPHARNVADLALFDQVITGEPRVAAPVPLPGLRLGVARDYFFESLDEEVAAITQAALGKLADAGVVLVETDAPHLASLVERITDPVQSYHAYPMLARYLEEFGTGMTFDEMFADVSEDVAALFGEYVLPDAPLRPSDERFAEIRNVELPAYRQAMRAWFEANELDAMIFPCTQVAATPIGQDVEVELNGRLVSFFGVMGRNIAAGSTAGIPGLVLPAALNAEGLPVSLEIDGPAGSDRRLLAIGLAIERVLGTLPPPPLRA